MINESLVNWFKSVDIQAIGKDNKRGGGSTILVHDIFVDYVCFCMKRGHKKSDIATARQLSDYLEGVGYEKKRICTGMAFVLDKVRRAADGIE